jgi:putative transcriptional regulator
MEVHARKRLDTGRPMPGVMIIHQQVRVADAIAALVLVAECSDPAEWNGLIQFLPRWSLQYRTRNVLAGLVKQLKRLYGEKAEQKNEFFEGLKSGLLAAIDHADGKQADLGTPTLPHPPKPLSAKEIVLVRTNLNVSQAVFARCLNISPRKVQSWEQGLGKPSGASLKLLSLITKDPKLLFEA